MKNLKILPLSALVLSFAFTLVTSCQNDEAEITTNEIEAQASLSVTTVNQSQALLAILAVNPELKEIGWDAKIDPKTWPGVTSISNVVRALEISTSALVTLPKEIEGLKYLKTLTINNSSLTTLPIEIGALTELEILNLGQNQLTEIPEEIESLTRLEKLLLYSNNLQSIPSTIGKLKKLKGLSLRNNQLYTLPGEVKNLKNLRWINLENNEFHILPIALEELTNLPSQNILSTGNPITALDKEQAQLLLKILSKYPQLENQGWDITRDPKDWNGINTKDDFDYIETNKIQKLSISGNFITTIPQEIFQISTIGILRVTNTSITKVPKEIENLRLYDLDLSNNALTELPYSIRNLTSILYLRLDSNQLTSLPYSISKFTYLEHLSATNNPLQNVPQAICDLGPSHAFDSFVIKVDDGVLCSTSGSVPPDHYIDDHL